jgi:hypothetical protein
VRLYGNLLGLFPYDARSPNLVRLRERLWKPRDERFLVPAFFGVGWTAKPRGAPYHPLQAPVLAAFVLWRIRRGRDR